MKEFLEFYRCEKCGNLCGMIKDCGPQLVCCGEPMTLLKANTTDASQEKHIPVVERKDGKIYVSVGSAPHPMEEKHFIEWIVVSTENTTKRYKLNPAINKEAKTVSCDTDEIGFVYAYCNLHGLWVVPFK